MVGDHGGGDGERGIGDLAVLVLTWLYFLWCI